MTDNSVFPSSSQLKGFQALKNVLSSWFKDALRQFNYSYIRQIFVDFQRLGSPKGFVQVALKSV